MLEDYARARTDRNTTVRFGESGSYTDMNGNIVVDGTTPPDGTTGARYVATRGLLSHEILHEQLTNREVWEEFKKGMEEDISSARHDWQHVVNQLRAIPEAIEQKELEVLLREGAARREHLLRVARPALEAERAALSARATKKAADLDAQLAALDAEVADIDQRLQGAPARIAAIQAAHPEIAALEAQMHEAANRLLLATQVKDSFNILEDGRIEEYCREMTPLEYRRISLLNRVSPRIPDTYTLPSEMGATLVPAPDGYIPVDAAGNELPVIDAPDGTRQVVIEPDVEIPVWTDRPLDLKRQMRAALLAESVPEFTPGDVHPDVAACLDECRPHVDGAIAGSTATCLDESRTVTEIMARHNMLPKSEDGGSTSGGDEGQQGGSPGQGGQPGQGGEGGPQGQGGTSGTGDVVRDDWHTRGDGGSAGEGASEASGGASDQDEAKGTSKGQRDKNERDGKGSASSDDAKNESSVADTEAKGREQNITREKARAQANGDIEGGAWKGPGSQDIIGEQTIAAQGDTGQTEFGRLRNLGRQLSAELKELTTQAHRPLRHQQQGKLDRRRLHKVPISAAVARETGINQSPRVFYHPGKTVALDLAAEVVVDLSGSMSGHREQLRDATIACHFALEELKVPHGIWGFDSSHGAEARHYEFKSIARDGAQALGEIASRRNAACAAGGGTPTDSAVEFSTTRMGVRRESAKLMFVFTDGMPNGTRDPIADTRRRVNDARQQGITVVGILFEERNSGWGGASRDAMREIFGNEFIEINELGEMPRHLGRLLRSLMTQRASR